MWRKQFSMWQLNAQKVAARSRFWSNPLMGFVRFDVYANRISFAFAQAQI